MRQPTIRQRIVVALGIAIASGLLRWLFAHYYSRVAGGDFEWAWYEIRDLVAGRNPYSMPYGYDKVPYPLPAALAALPFAWLPITEAAAVFWGVSSGLLAFGLTRTGWTRLGIFAAYPYWAAFISAQWIPLAMAAFFFPVLPILAVKPQIGIPITIASRWRPQVTSSAALLLLSLVVYPRWPFIWLSQIRGFQHFSPLWFGPGVVLAIALFWWRDTDARLLLSAAAMPQHWLYDAFILWLIPETAREIAVTVSISWVAFVLWFRVPVVHFHDLWMWSVCCNYLPMLGVVAMRRYLVQLRLPNEIGSWRSSTSERSSE